MEERKETSRTVKSEPATMAVGMPVGMPMEMPMEDMGGVFFISLRDI